MLTTTPALRIVLGLFILGALLPAPAAAQRNNKVIERLLEGQRREPLIFIVAKGARDACGPGCDTWIAVEGRFDQHAAKRFTSFIAVPERRALPVFFNSPGGSSGSAISIGQELRRHRMIVGVGRTAVQGCDDSGRLTERCRRVMAEKTEHTARLVVRNARCFSACSFAILGGSARLVDPAAKLGIHASRFYDGTDDDTIQAWKQRTKRYVIEMGVASEFVDAASKVSPDDLRILKSGEIARFGISGAARVETDWVLLDRLKGESATVIKSVSQPEKPAQKFRRTEVFRFTCAANGDGVVFIYRRDSQKNISGAIRVDAGESSFVFASQALAGTYTDLRYTVVGAQFLLATAEAPEIRLTEVEPGSEDAKELFSRVSTSGLATALVGLLKTCKQRLPIATNATQPRRVLTVPLIVPSSPGRLLPPASQ